MDGFMDSCKGIGANRSCLHLAMSEASGKLSGKTITAPGSGAKSWNKSTRVNTPGDGTSAAGGRNKFVNGTVDSGLWRGRDAAVEGVRLVLPGGGMVADRMEQDGGEQEEASDHPDVANLTLK